MKRLSILCLCLFGTLWLAACQPTTPQAALPLPQYRIGVAPFTQPTQASQLLAGYISETQRLLSTEDFLTLDSTFDSKLRGLGRDFVFLSPDQARIVLHPDYQGRNSVLAGWVQQAQAAGVDLILVPQVLNWRERVGGPGGATESAAVSVDFFLIDARGEGQLLQRSHFQAEQETLADNLLNFGSFISRKGRWVSAAELVGEGMDQAIREFGLAQ